MPLIQQNEVYPAVSIPWAQAVECVAGAGGVSRHDLVLITANARSGSSIPSAVVADADNTSLHAGVVLIATGAATVGEKFMAVPWIVLTDVDSSAATGAGYPVYMSVTPGEWTATKPAGANDAIVPVGVVLEDHATTGVVMLNPGSVTVSGFQKAGTATVAAGGTTVTVSLGLNFASGLAVASLSASSGATLYVHTAAIDAAGDLLITVDQDPAGADTAVVSYVAYSAAV